MTPHSYKIVSTHAHEISGWTILFILLHSCAPNIVDMDNYVQSNLASMSFKNGEKLEDFHNRILRLQQEIILSGENKSPKRLIFLYMKEFSKKNKLKSLLEPNMIDLITFLDNNIKYAV